MGKPTRKSHPHSQSIWMVPALPETLIVQKQQKVILSYLQYCMFARIICMQSRHVHVQLQLWRFCRFLRNKWYVQFKFYFVSDIGILCWLDIYNEWSYFVAVQTEMTAEERRKKHQLELKEQLHEEAKVCKTICVSFCTLLGFLLIWPMLFEM